MHAALVARPCPCIRRLAGTRAREIQFTRFLRNGAVTATEMASHAARRTAVRAAGRDVVVIQDTSELALGGRRAKASGYGPVGKGGALRGLLLHAVLAVDARSGGVLGLVDAKVWNRKGGKAKPRRARRTPQKESQRWLDATSRAGEVLAAANSITGVSDRESDIYEHFARRPDNVHLIVRACQNRKIQTGDADQVNLLFSHVDGQPEQGRFTVKIPAAPGRKARVTELAVRFSRVVLRKPLHGAAPDLPATITLTMVDVRETSKPEDGKPIHWRLLTTHEVTSLGEARRIVDLYRLRWTIEEFFHTLKTAGFDIEAADIGDPQVMIKFVAAAAVAAVTVMQLVKARDDTTGQRLADAFEPADQPILEAVSAQLEGKTSKQKNPHPSGSLAFAAWVIARLGGWTGYYGKPGPQVMRRGLDDFQRIKYGATLRLQHV
ncbi:MAG TPA: IS4 family transposase [Bradyrhizobium sp.]|nr:IS4 family transposase [Bradyrhizobium sp.]